MTRGPGGLMDSDSLRTSGGALHYPPRPTFGEAVLLLLVMLAASGLAMLAILLGRRGAEFDILLLGAVEVFAILLALLLGVRAAGAGAHEIFALRRVTLGMIAAPVPLAAALAVLISATEAPIQRAIPMPEEFAIYMAGLLYPEHVGDWIRIVSVAVIAIPLGEELLFRGLFLRGFLLRYGPVPALAFSSLLFAIVHLNPWGFVGIFLMGWLLGWLVLRSGSLWPSILLHGLYNLSSILLLKASFKEPPSPEALAKAGAGLLGMPAVVALCALVGAGLIVLIGRRGGQEAPWATRGSVSGASPAP